MEAKILLSDMDISGDLYYDKSEKKWYIKEGTCGYLFEIDRATLVFGSEDVIDALRRRNPWFYWQMTMKYDVTDGGVRNVYYKRINYKIDYERKYKLFGLIPTAPKSYT